MYINVYSEKTVTSLLPVFFGSIQNCTPYIPESATNPPSGGRNNYKNKSNTGLLQIDISAKIFVQLKENVVH